ncbi:MAG: metallophosphoesterase [Candidatus Scalinduaceae bacterium]
MLLTLPLLNIYSFLTVSLEVVWQDIILNQSLNANKAIRLVQLSDLHLHSFEDIHEKIIHKVNRINPDILFITGDIINESKNLPLLYDFVSRLKASSGIYSVLGNWDYWSLAGINNIMREYEKANCRLLVNEKVDISLNSINISLIGVDDFMVGKPDLTWYQNNPLQASYKILLSHCPGYRDQIGTEAFDLMLSGHTHGGQINIFGYTLYTPRGSGSYVAGWYNYRKPRLYVNRGIGTTFLPIRIGSRPEITVFRICESST